MKKHFLWAGLLAALSIPSVKAADPAPSDLPQVSVVASDPTAFEGFSSGAFTVYRAGTNDNLAVKLQYSGSASNGVDYATLPDSVTIPAGFHSVGLTVTPLASSKNFESKRVELTIVSNATYQVIRPRTAVVKINDNLFENVGPSVAITSPANNTSVGQPVSLTITASATDPDDSIQSVSFFANDHLIGKSKASPYSVIWSNAAVGNYGLFARAEDAFGKSSVSSVVTVTVTNNAPVIRLTSPADGSVFSQPANITIAAETSGGTTTVKKVSFYEGDDLIGTVTNAPYSLVWSNAPRGHFTLFARETDNEGSVAYSQKVSITVSNAAPTVQITEPADNTIYASGDAITIKASASDSDGSIDNVMFFDNGRFLRAIKTEPYTLVWTNAAPGKHSVTARAVDLQGLSAVSAPVHIVVSNSAPTITLTSPVDGASFAAPATIELKADASDADGIRSVTFWSKGHLVGISTKAPYALTLNRVETGNYEFIAKAMDRFEQIATSAAVHVTVTNTVSHGPHSGH
ncbi:MAG: large protein [Verrucomicrobiales bacterium]|nr:large protein [Verrucomicrobiales bacterium]